MLCTSSFSKRQAARDAVAAAAAAKQNGTRKQDTTSESAAMQGVENMERSGPVLGTDAEPLSQEASLFKEGAREIVENKLLEDNHDDDNIRIHPEFSVKRCKVEEAKTQLLLSETEQESEFNQKTDHVGEDEEIHNEHLTLVDVLTTVADTKPGPPHRDEHVTAAYVERTTDHDIACGSNDGDYTHSGAADIVSGSEHLPGTDAQIKDRDLKNNKPVVVNLDQAEDSDKQLAPEFEEEDQSNLEDEYKDSVLGVSDEIKSHAECPYKEAVETKVHVSKDGEMPDNETVETENFQSAAPYSDAEYVAALEKAKQRLKATSVKPDDNSVLNSLRFYTREEHLDEYFCTTCNEGRVLCHLLKCFAFLVATCLYEPL